MGGRAAGGDTGGRRQADQDAEKQEEREQPGRKQWQNRGPKGSTAENHNFKELGESHLQGPDEHQDT